MKQNILSSNEFAVMRVLWQTDHSLSRPEILDKLRQNEWNPNSIHSVLNNLIKKGLVVVDGVVPCGQSYGRAYAPAKTQMEYAADLAIDAADTQVEESVPGIVSAMVNRAEISAETLALLRQMLDERQDELRRQGK